MSSPPPPGHRDSPGLMFALLGRHTMRRLRDAYTINGLTPRQFQILSLLRDRGPIGQTDLATLIEVAASILVTQLNPLEAGELITRSRDPRDRRRHVVVITDAGLERLARAGQAHQAVEDDVFRTLTADQRAQLTALLRLIRDDVTDGGEHCATVASLDH